MINDIFKNRENKVLELIEILLKENIYHAKYINSVNRSLNHNLIYLIKNKNKKIYQDIYDLTDEMSLLADTAIHSTTIEHISLSNHFRKKQKELKFLYDKLKES